MPLKKKIVKNELLALRQKYRSGKIRKGEYIDRCHACHRRLFDYPGFMRRTEIARIEIFAQGVCLVNKESSLKMMISPIDKRTAPIEMLNFGAAEKNELATIRALVRKNCGQRPAVIDVGGNIGWFCLSMAKMFPQGKIHSFEPIPDTYQRMRENIRLNGIKNIKTIQAGVSDHQGRTKFYCDQTITANASMVDHGQKKGVKEVQVRLVTLDNYCRQRGVRPSLLKVDVEGAELLVFRGARQLIARYRPIVYAEMLRKWSANFHYHPNQIIDLFREMGYQCFCLRQKKLVPFSLMTDKTKETNFFFLDRRCHRR